jgi:AcrR family transcriptional regulator
MGKDDFELAERASPGTSPRIAQARLAVSREAARLFWQQGVAATSGDQIAAAAGLSKRSVWRHFRSKESCVEPILVASSIRLVDLLASWSPEDSLESHLSGDLDSLTLDAQRWDDEVAAARMVILADRDPVVRTSWLMVVDQTEISLRPIVAGWLGVPESGMQARLVSGAVVTAIRVVTEHYTVGAVSGGRPATSREIVQVMSAAILTVVEGFAPAVARDQLVARVDAP